MKTQQLVLSDLETGKVANVPKGSYALLRVTKGTNVRGYALKGIEPGKGLFSWTPRPIVSDATVDAVVVTPSTEDEPLGCRYIYGCSFAANDGTITLPTRLHVKDVVGESRLTPAETEALLQQTPNGELPKKLKKSKS